MEEATMTLMMDVDPLSRKRDRPEPQVEQPGTKPARRSAEAEALAEAEAKEKALAEAKEKEKALAEADAEAKEKALAEAEAKAKEKALAEARLAKCMAIWTEEEEDDDPEREFKRYRKQWNASYSTYHSFYEESRIRPMTSTDDTAKGYVADAIQVFSIKIGHIKGGFQWPLHVFGYVAMRDDFDGKRNLVFSRKRDDCQTLTETDPYLTLTGPTRAVSVVDPPTIEFYLQVKGAVESEDRTLCFVVANIRHSYLPISFRLRLSRAVKFCTVEYTLGQFTCSVEATISIRVAHGSWPSGFDGQFTAGTATADKNERYNEESSVDKEKTILHHFGSGEVPVAGAEFNLSRNVVSAEEGSKLQVSVKGSCGESVVANMVEFTATKAGWSKQTLPLESCMFEVTVFWSVPAFAIEQ